MREKYAVSACLLGCKCKYSGKDNYSEKVCAFLSDKDYIPICPELEGGLKVPRDPAEIVSNGDNVSIVTNRGADVSKEYLLGAEACMDKIKQFGASRAILKEKSPSCGVKKIYDGSFCGVLISGMGVCAKLFLKNGIELYSETDF